MAGQPRMRRRTRRLERVNWAPTSIKRRRLIFLEFFSSCKIATNIESLTADTIFFIDSKMFRLPLKIHHPSVCSSHLLLRRPFSSTKLTPERVSLLCSLQVMRTREMPPNYRNFSTNTCVSNFVLFHIKVFIRYILKQKGYLDNWHPVSWFHRKPWFNYLIIRCIVLYIVPYIK